MNEWLRRALFLPEQASTFAREIDTLHYFVIIVTMLGALAVTAFTLYFILKYRETSGRGGDPVSPALSFRLDPASPAPAPDERPGYTAGGVPLWLEAAVFGGLLGLFVVWWVLGFRQYATLTQEPPGAIPIYVTGKQWMWSFAYPNGSGSNGVLYVPAGRPVKLVMTSRDVIHSFYVPDFRVKRDVVPGRSTTLWFEAPRPGRHHLFCTELCGTGHSQMRGEVIVLPADEYERRLEGLLPVEIAAPITSPGGDAQRPEQPSLAAIGERVAARRGCMRCHTADGTAHLGPTWAGLFGATVLLDGGTRVLADEAYLTSSMMDPAAQLHRGFLPIMPSYQGLLTAPEVGAIVEYIRSLRDVSRTDGDEPPPVPTGRRVPLVTPLPTGETP